MNKLLAIYLLILCAGPAARGQTLAVEDWLGAQTLPDEALPVADLGQLTRSYWGADRRDPQERLRPTTERSRGAGLDVYPQVAPAVVVVRTAFGHGTGFFIRKDGWVLTNHHVVEDASYSAEHGGQVVAVHRGILGADGWMERLDEPLTGLVFVSDSRRDLALVKLVDMPDARHGSGARSGSGARRGSPTPPTAGLPSPASDSSDDSPSVPFLELADTPPRPGTDCVAIGHPASGTLWTVRSGILAGAGTFPDDHMDQVAKLFRTTGADRERLETQLRAKPDRRRVLLSTCGLNPGDSGGPLVDAQGRVIGVSYGLPVNDPQRGVDLGKFSYHVHLDEVQAFLSAWPEEPRGNAPNPVASGAYAHWLDVDQDGYYDTLRIGRGPKGDVTGLLLDLDGDSFGGKPVRQLAGPDFEPSLDAWEYEFAVALYPRRRFAFDTDNDATIDLVFSDEDLDGELDTEIRLVDGAWKVSRQQSPEIGPSLFRSPQLRQRYDQLLGQSQNKQ